jgi:ribose-phosphate pyrophosphokinase
MNGLCVVGQKDAAFAQQIALALGVPLHQLLSDYFADSESYVEFNGEADIAGQTILFVYQFTQVYQGLDQNSGICINHQLFCLLQAIRKLALYKPAKIITVLPYLPYARQERPHVAADESPFSFLLRLLRFAGADEIITTDLHGFSNNLVQYDRLIHISLDQWWVLFLQEILGQEQFTGEACIVSPDAGGMARAQHVAALLNVDVASIQKIRQQKDQAVAIGMIGDVRGKVAVILDDIIDTGRTAIQACELLRRNGARRVIGCFSHAVLSSGALERLSSCAFDAVFISDTLIVDGCRYPANVQFVPLQKYFVEKIVEITKSMNGLDTWTVSTTQRLFEQL